MSPVRPALKVVAATDPALHGQWLFVEYECAIRFGAGLRPAFSELIELDLRLRRLELQKMRSMTQAHCRDLRPTDDLMLSMSESWVRQAHDLLGAARTAAQALGQPLPPRLRDLQARVDLLRPALAEAPAPQGRPFWVALAAGIEPGEVAQRVPRAICDRTGSVIWWPVAQGSAIPVEVHRRSLSDAFLSALD